MALNLALKTFSFLFLEIALFKLWCCFFGAQNSQFSA